MQLNEKLQILRKEAGLSQERLAEKLGVSRQAVSKWESGQSTPDIENLSALSDLFGVTLDELIKKESAPQPAQAVRPAYGGTGCSYRFEYEYKSKRKFLGLPLVHIHIGRGLCKAKGILAIGNLSAGLLSFGLISAGVLSIGALSLGLVAFGALAIGLLLAIGGFSAGTFAVGGICAGVFALGGIAIGMFSTGGVAIASHVAIGGFASGHIAIGDVAHGVQTIHIDANSLTSVSAEQVRTLIQQEFPGLWQFAVDWCTLFFR